MFVCCWCSFVFVDHHFGRAVVMVGVPYVYTQSRILKVSCPAFVHVRVELG